MNNSATKFAIQFYPKGDKQWFKLLLLKYPNVELVPALRDLHRIIQALALCEDENYPPPAQGRGQLIPFLRDCVTEPDFDKLAVKYKIPERDGDRVVKTNGARIDIAAASLPLRQK